MIDTWSWCEWAVFAFGCSAAAAWILYGYGMWYAGRPADDFDRRHDDAQS